MSLKKNYRYLLKKGRIRNGWTQLQAAEMIGISRSYYSDIENGRIFPSGKTLFSINEVIPIFLPLNDVDTASNDKEGAELNVQ